MISGAPRSFSHNLWSRETTNTKRLKRHISEEEGKKKKKIKRKTIWGNETAPPCPARTASLQRLYRALSRPEEPGVQQCCQLRPQAVSKSPRPERSFCSAWEVKWEVISLKKPPSEDLLIKKKKKKTTTPGSCNLLELLQGVALWKPPSSRAKRKKLAQIYYPDGKT